MHKELTNLFYIVSVVLLILLSIYNLENISKKPNGVLGTSREVRSQELEKEKVYWEELLSKNPTYYDGWIKLSEIEFLLGNETSAIESLEITKRIDANH